MTKRSGTALTTAAILILAACGAADDTSSESADGAMPTTLAPGGLRVPTPIEVVGGGAPGADNGTAAESAPAVGGGEIATSDLAIAPWNVEYVVGDSMPALPTDDTGYVYDGSTATADDVARLADVFGVEGEPVSFDEGFGVSWRIGSDDGSGASIWVAADGALPWNYNAPWADSFELCAVSVDSEGNESSDCADAVSPAGVPSAEQAEASASEWLASLGVDVSNVTFETVDDEWFTSVGASDGTDARAAVRAWNFGFGGEGLLQFASGALATPQPVGPYPLVDLDTAVSRLSDGFLGGLAAGGGVAVAEPGLPTMGAVEVAPAEGGAVAGDPGEPPETGDEPVTNDPADPDEPIVEEPVEPIVDEPAEPMPVEPVPVEPVPEGEPAVITLVDVQADLWWAWDADGVVWLLPAYRFIDADGGWHVVPAVTDEFLIQVEPPMIDTPLPEPAPEPLPAPPPDAPEVIEPDVDPDAALELFEEFVGLSIDEFAAEAAALGYTTRVVMEDGEPLAVTADYSETRVNVAVEGPRVVAVEGIG